MPEPIRFLLNGEELAVAGLSPQTTLLDFLREQRALAERLRADADADPRCAAA